MKRKLGAILLVVALVVTLGLVPAALVGASPGPGIVGLWHFDGDADDSSGNANHGTVTGATFVSGKFDEALSFDGSDDYVSVSDSTSLDITSAITVEGWIKLASFSQPSTVAAKWKDIGGANLRGYLLTVATDGTPRFYISTTGSNYPRATGSALSLNTWYHLAGTYDGTNIKLYVDGTLVATTAQTGAIFSNNEPLLIGANDGYGGLARKFTNGLIDEVRIWDQALTAGQIAESASLGDLVFTKELESAEDEGSAPVDPDAVPLGERIWFTMVITVDNTLTGLTLNDVAVKDRLGAELELDAGDADLTPSTGTATHKTKGNSQKVFIDWDVGATLGAASETLGIEANTDYNPGGGKKAPHQEYTTPTGDGPPYELNSGATLTFYVTIAGEEIWLVLTTDPLLVTVVGEEED